ncbi:MAG TPA: dihydroneopterin aldolase [Aeromicrobium sp.]|nr:dihydroneopterin aldolase [Aeromicrobium sp.]HKY58683.1 dihydroneopterin aldolase [Aeromicrobium sp.]
MSCPDGLDRIDLTGIGGWGYHGVHDDERENGQRFVVDVSLGLNLGAAATTDDLGLTVDYGDLAEGVHQAIAAEPLQLIESVAQRVMDLCLKYHPVLWASVTVHKPMAPISVPFTDVSVTIERRK